MNVGGVEFIRVIGVPCRLCGSSANVWQLGTFRSCFTCEPKEQACWRARALQPFADSASVFEWSHTDARR